MRPSQLPPRLQIPLRSQAVQLPRSQAETLLSQVAPAPSQVQSQAVAHLAWPITHSLPPRSAQLHAHAVARLDQAICHVQAAPAQARAVLAQPAVAAVHLSRVVVQVDRADLAQAELRAVALSDRVAEAVHHQQ